MINLIAIAVVVAAVVGAALYIRAKKKKGAKCIGCPYADSCGAKQCSCQSEK